MISQLHFVRIFNVKSRIVNVQVMIGGQVLSREAYVSILNHLNNVQD